MPYIKRDDGRREALRNDEPALSAGELNYQIFYFIKHNFGNYEYDLEFLDFKVRYFVNKFLGDKPNYQRYNDMTGALHRCNKEIIRRLKIYTYLLIEICDSYDEEIAKYEDKKIIENMDVE